MIQLYDFALSGSCHKVRMLLALLRLDRALIDVNLLSGDQNREDFLRINPLNKVPVLTDGDVVLRDSTAIMVYLACKYGGPKWWPNAPEDLGDIQQWLSFSVNEIYHGVATARATILFQRDLDLTAPYQTARKSLEVMERQLARQPWLACGRLTIADLACYPYVALAYQGDISLVPYPAVRNWIARIEGLPDYLAMPGLPMPG